MLENGLIQMTPIFIDHSMLRAVQHGTSKSLLHHHRWRVMMKRYRFPLFAILKQELLQNHTSSPFPIPWCEMSLVWLMRDSVDVADPLHPIRTMGVMGHIIVIDRVSLLLRMSDKGKEQKLIEMRGGEHILAQSSISVDDLDTRRDRKPAKHKSIWAQCNWGKFTF